MEKLPPRRTAGKKRPTLPLKESYFAVNKLVVRLTAALTRIANDRRLPEHVHVLAQQYDSDLERLEKAVHALRGRFASAIEADEERKLR